MEAMGSGEIELLAENGVRHIFSGGFDGECWGELPSQADQCEGWSVCRLRKCGQQVGRFCFGCLSALSGDDGYEPLSDDLVHRFDVDEIAGLGVWLAAEDQGEFVVSPESSHWRLGTKAVCAANWLVRVVPRVDAESGGAAECDHEPSLIGGFSVSDEDWGQGI